MCIGRPKIEQPAPPPPPPPVLQQEAPERAKAGESKDRRQSIGTSRYRAPSLSIGGSTGEGRRGRRGSGLGITGGGVGGL